MFKNEQKQYKLWHAKKMRGNNRKNSRNMYWTGDDVKKRQKWNKKYIAIGCKGFSKTKI